MLSISVLSELTELNCCELVMIGTLLVKETKPEDDEVLYGADSDPADETLLYGGSEVDVK